MKDFKALYLVRLINITPLLLLVLSNLFFICFIHKLNRNDVGGAKNRSKCTPSGFCILEQWGGRTRFPLILDSSWSSLCVLLLFFWFSCFVLGFFLVLFFFVLWFVTDVIPSVCLQLSDTPFHQALELIYLQVWFQIVKLVEALLWQNKSVLQFCGNYKL